MLCALFFFQAEDGIRYLVRSRGLGDVYKRQVPVRFFTDKMRDSKKRTGPGGRRFLQEGALDRNTVSYTHLTLPTSDLV